MKSTRPSTNFDVDLNFFIFFSDQKYSMASNRIGRQTWPVFMCTKVLAWQTIIPTRTTSKSRSCTDTSEIRLKKLLKIETKISYYNYYISKFCIFQKSSKTDETNRTKTKILFSPIFSPPRIESPRVITLSYPSTKLTAPS